MDDYDDFDEELDLAQGQDDVSPLSDDELELLGGLDGELDTMQGVARYSGYGSSIDLDSLSEEQQEAYENGYFATFDDFEGDGPAD